MKTPGTFVTVYRSPVYAACQERFIVLRIAGLQACIEQLGDVYVLMVDVRDSDRALSELADYAAEAEPRVPPALIVSKGSPGAAAWAAILMTFYVLAHHRAFELHWLAAGAAQAGLIREGEWWRTVTALCLHADIAHLVGNIVLGALLVSLVAKRLGWGLMALGILAAGAFGNAINAIVQPAAHSSIGASTAVFGALGILAIHGWRRNTELKTRAVERWAPLVAGVLLLAMFGMAGERTDVVAHTTGFFCGLLAGAFATSLDVKRLRQPHTQARAGIGALALLGAGWLLAFL